MSTNSEDRPGLPASPSGAETGDGRLALAEAAFRLKDEPRGGWVLRGVRDPESVADHSWGTALLCALYAEEAGVDTGGAVKMALVHDLAEAETGDIVAQADPADRSVGEERKAALEAAAVHTLLRDDFTELRAAWQAYEDRASAIALFVRDMNLIDMCMQAVIYHEEHRYDRAVAIPSRGGFTHLDEFFASAAPRLST